MRQLILMTAHPLPLTISPPPCPAVFQGPKLVTLESHVCLLQVWIQKYMQIMMEKDTATSAEAHKPVDTSELPRSSAKILKPTVTGCTLPPTSSWNMAHTKAGLIWECDSRQQS